MSIANVSIPTAPNLGSLTNLMCHLLIGGNFQFVQFLYDSKVFDSQLIDKIKCLNGTPWMGVDIDSEIQQWNFQSRKEESIQLIFPSLEALDKFTQLEKDAIYHRLFVFTLDSATVSDLSKVFEFGKKNIISSQGSLFLIHDNFSQETKVYLTTQNSNESPIHIQKNDIVNDPVILFDKLFKRFHRMWILGVETPIGFDCQPADAAKRIPVMIVPRFLANLYFTKMKLDFIEETVYKCGESKLLHAHAYVCPAVQATYNEFSSGNAPLSQTTSSKLNQDNAPILELFFDTNSAAVGSSNRSRFVPLYPYMNNRIKLMFFYGNDYKLRVGPPSILEIIVDYWFIAIWFVITTISLHLIRIKAKMKNADFSVSVLQMLVIFFGGGNLSFRNKGERYFLVVMLFGSFFLQSLWVSDFLSKMSSLNNFNRVNSLEKLAELNTPIYFTHSLQIHEKESIIDLLKKRMGERANVKDFIYAPTLIALEHSRVLATLHTAVLYVKLNAGIRDVDIFTETLTEFPTKFYLRSDHIIPDGIIESFNQFTAFLIDSGLYDMYWSMARFLIQIRARNDPKKEEIAFHGFSLRQLGDFFIIYVICMVLALLIFIVELIVFKIKVNGNGKMYVNVN